MMTVQVEELSEISIFPYYQGLALEVDAVARGGVGRYESGHFAGQAYHTLVVDRAEVSGDLHVGATYSCTALSGGSNSRMTTHWLFCTSVGDAITFGISRHWSDPKCFSPVLPQIDSVLVQVEELTDIVALFPASGPEGSVSQARIGASGWLVMTRLGCPSMMGILVSDAVLPMAFCEGSDDIVIAARSVRTMQSITLDSLSCVSAKDTALFLRQVQ
ncbi:hypothetical protein [uncultured Tateyamaria sp.]|uniref:hypothetical protein n=1 Tax=Tateyamaria sp. 1078 TaxID=3417464 RepID=UPI00262D2241|nr:hypothetical protein [uncultured Tateyamaria sp.]